MLRKKASEEKPGGATSSQYRGVSFNSHSQKWKAVITVGRKQYFLGYFVQETEAARAYDKASLELRGPEAPTNFKYDKATLEAAAVAKQNNQGTQPPHPVEETEGEDEMEVETGYASLEKLDSQTNDSMESVRDAEVEVNAVRATLMMRQQAIINARNQSNQRMKPQQPDDIPSEFLCL